MRLAVGSIPTLCTKSPSLAHWLVQALDKCKNEDRYLGEGLVIVFQRSRYSSVTRVMSGSIPTDHPNPKPPTGETRCSSRHYCSTQDMHRLV